MKPRERRETGEQDLFRSRLDQIINMDHELVRLAGTISWHFIEVRCGEAYKDGPGMPPLPTRLMAGKSSAAGRFTACMRLRSSASAKARRMRLTSSG